MKLITELNESVEIITEARENGKKDYYIKGIFMQGNMENRNKRMYPMEILDREVNRYNEQYVQKNRAYGELGHPSGPTINLDRVSHIIKELARDGDNYIGKAKITTETPMGQIVKGLMDAGGVFGVSSRGLGSLKPNRQGVAEVQKDFYLATAADIVADPSAPDAFVEGIMESKEWIWDNGVLRESTIDDYRQTIEKTSSKDLEEAKLRVFKDFFARL